jgi:hypothetical protein
MADEQKSNERNFLSAAPRLLEMVNGAEGISDIEGKVTRVERVSVGGE